MKTAPFALSALTLAALLTGCGKSKAKEEPPTAEPPRGFETCSAGDQAFVKNAYLAVLGQRPQSQAEINLYVDLLHEARGLAEAGQLPGGHKAAERWLVGALALEDGYAERWSEHFMDALRIHRIDVQSQRGCYERPARARDDGSLAAWIRTRGPSEPGDGAGPFNMADLLRSALVYDDLSTVYRGHLFAMMNAPIPAANVGPVEAELARREDFGNQFDDTYLHRDIVCLGCHTSTYSITSHSEAAKNRHWPLPGDFESALFGKPEGIDPARAHAPFRYDGFVADGFNDARAEVRPWRWHAACGTFQQSGIAADPAAIDGFFGNLRGDRLTVFDLERSLFRGADLLAEGNLPEAGSVPDPDVAFAYLVAAKIVEGVWAEVVGSPLTIANYFPRNRESRDILQELTASFVKSRFSLKTLIADILTSPYTNRLPPSAGCGVEPYNMPAIFDPWSISDDVAERRKNSGGDAVAALSSRTLLRTAYGALGWQTPLFTSFPERGFFIEFCIQQFSCEEMEAKCNDDKECCVAHDFQCKNPPGPNQPTAEELRSLQRGMGVFLNNGEPGFRGLDFQARLMYEDAFGACTNPDDGPDFITRLARSAVDQKGTLRDAVVALKDRLVNEPAIEETARAGRTERDLVEAIFQTRLDAPAATVTDLEPNLRAMCGVLLSSPQFLLSGFPAPDTTVVPVLTPAEANYGAACRHVASFSAARLGAVLDCGLGKAELSPR